VFGKDTSNDIPVDIDAEGFGDLLGDSAATKARVALFERNDRLDEFR